MEQTSKNKDTKNGNWVEEAWKKYSPQIYNLCRMSCESSEDAKDVFQNIGIPFFPGYFGFLGIVSTTMSDSVKR